MRFLAFLAAVLVLRIARLEMVQRLETIDSLLVFIPAVFLYANKMRFHWLLAGILNDSNSAKYTFKNSFNFISNSLLRVKEALGFQIVNHSKRHTLIFVGINAKNVTTLLLVFLSLKSFSQLKRESLPKREIDFTATLGQRQGAFALGYDQLFPIVKNSKLHIGYGVRLTNYIGDKRDFITAGPAKYTRSFTTPFLIVVAGQREVNFDTLVVQMPIVFSLNAAFHSAYQFNNKLSAGFNIDVIGFTIARKTSAVFKSNGLTRTDPSVKPTNFNLLLTGDHDLGTLNSELFLKYNWNKRWSYKLVYQFLFVEYKSSLYKQQFSDGVETNRFRNKVNALGLGVTYNLKSK